MGSKNAITFGYLLLIFTTFGLGLISYLPKGYVRCFTYISVLVRLIQGYADSLIQTTTFSLIISLFPDNTTEVLGFAEAAIGFGVLLGPPIGSITYAAMNIQWAFYVFAFI